MGGGREKDWKWPGGVRRLAMEVVEDHGPGDCGNGNECHDCRNDCDDPPATPPVAPLVLHPVAPSVTQTWLWRVASTLPVVRQPSRSARLMLSPRQPSLGRTARCPCWVSTRAPAC